MEASHLKGAFLKSKGSLRRVVAEPASELEIDTQSAAEVAHETSELEPEEGEAQQ